MKKIKFLVFAFLVSSASSAIAQSYSLDMKSSSLSVIGTSTLHDWKLKADSISGKAKLTFSENKLDNITSLSIHVLVASLQSGLDPLDIHMRKALSSNDAIYVDYQLTKTTKITPNTIGYTIQAEGDITIIKNVKQSRMQATMELRKNGDIRFFGETMIDMTDYSVELPQAEMGSIKSEKDVKVIFDVVFTKQ
jgi:polyisoprenoid-binding protein YceI